MLPIRNNEYIASGQQQPRRNRLSSVLDCRNLWRSWQDERHRWQSVMSAPTHPILNSFQGVDRRGGEPTLLRATNRRRHQPLEDKHCKPSHMRLNDLPLGYNVERLSGLVCPLTVVDDGQISELLESQPTGERRQPLVPVQLAGQDQRSLSTRAK